MLSKVEQQQQKQQNQRNIVAAEGGGCVGRPRLEITAEQLEYLFGYDSPSAMCPRHQGYRNALSRGML